MVKNSIGWHRDCTSVRDSSQMRNSGSLLRFHCVNVSQIGRMKPRAAKGRRETMKLERLRNSLVANLTVFGGCLALVVTMAQVAATGQQQNDRNQHQNDKNQSAKRPAAAQGLESRRDTKTEK